jgi:hypothetical protein
MKQTYYLAVPSDKNINFFRVRVEADVKLGEASFKSGWFPAAAVDNLYGDTSQQGAVEAFRVQEQLKGKYDAAILKTTEGYLNAAQDPTSSADLVQSWLIAQRRVRAAAGAETPLPLGAVELEYGPGKTLATPHAGQKLVVVLSSDPTSVIEAISTFSRDVQTGATVMKLADVVRQQAANDIAVTEARNDARDKSDALVAEHISTLIELIKKEPQRADLLRELESLRILLETFR